MDLSVKTPKTVNLYDGSFCPVNLIGCTCPQKEYSWSPQNFLGFGQLPPQLDMASRPSSLRFPYWYALQPLVVEIHIFTLYLR